MLGRWLHILILLWTATWFGVIAPGHQRGIAPVPGRPVMGSSCHGGCAMATAPTATDDQAPREDRGGRAKCGICNILATLTTPPILDLNIVFLGLVELRPIDGDIRAAHVSPHFAWSSRGPPVC